MEIACQSNICCYWLLVDPSIAMLAPPWLDWQNGENTNFKVSIDESKMHEEDGVLTNDVKGVIRPALKDLKVAIVRRTQEFRQASRLVSFLYFFIPARYRRCRS